MSDSDDKLASRHSFCTPSYSPKRSTQTVCKSDVNLRHMRIPTSHETSHSTKSSAEYYKRYDHDEIPVKDGSYSNTATGDSARNSLSNSKLDKLEEEVFKDMPRELQIENGSVESLDSHIKFFKSTVQQIFDNFYASMQDFELYKRKFHEILEKNKAQTVDEMEDFIKEMIQHIMSAESLVSNDSGQTTDTYDVKVQETPSTDERDLTASASSQLVDNIHSVVEAYKNDNYFSDSTVDENCSRNKDHRKEEIFNIYLLNATPFVEIKMNERSLLSEINIRDTYGAVESMVASADNMKKVSAKRQELESFVCRQQVDVPDREIPIKISSAKKNIHLDEDFVRSAPSEDKSIMSKICNYLCKKFRRSSIG